MVRQTSLRAYKDINLGKRQKEVYKAIKKHGIGTAREIYREMDKPGVYSGYQPRFTELREKGLLREIGKRKCNVTGRLAVVWDFNEVEQ